MSNGERMGGGMLPGDDRKQKLDLRKGKAQEDEENEQHDAH